MRYRVILLQPYLRRFFLNFGRLLKDGEFHNISAPSKKSVGYDSLPIFEKEILRKKVTTVTHLRRFFGIPNLRFYLSNNENEVCFTYGCLMITNRPYCTYIETGLALYNYDLQIAKNPIAQLIVIFLATRNNCKQLVFFSEASQKSFYATINYPKKVRAILQKKSIVIYPPAIEKKNIAPKKFGQDIKLLFPGTFYIKGGTEVVHAFEKLREKYDNVSLTIVTAVHMLRPEDAAYIKALPGATLLDAKLTEQEMIDIYTNHDLLLLPTYRDGFGLVLIEALAYGMPLIITDQYATKEMVREGENGFVYPNHPLKDYDPETYRLLGKYYNPKDFYEDLFRYQKDGSLKPVEDFLVASVERYLNDVTLLEKHSKNSLKLYEDTFDAQKVTAEMEAVFQKALEK